MPSPDIKTAPAVRPVDLKTRILAGLDRMGANARGVFPYESTNDNGLRTKSMRRLAGDVVTHTFNTDGTLAARTITQDASAILAEVKAEPTPAASKPVKPATPVVDIWGPITVVRNDFGTQVRRSAIRSLRG